MVEIVTLASTLADTSKDRVTTMSLGHIVNQLHDKYGLADASTAEKTNFTSLGIGSQQIDHLDASDQNFLLHRHLLKLGSFSVNGSEFVSVDGAPLVNGITNDVDDAAESLITDRNTNRSSGIGDLLSTDQTFGTVHGNGPDGILSQMLGNLKYQPWRTVCHVQGVENLGEAFIELNVDDGTDDCYNSAIVGGSRGGSIITFKL